MLRSAILAAARNRRLEQAVTHAPLSRSVVKRFVGGADTAAAVHATGRLVRQGLAVTLDHLGEDTTDREHADTVVRAYLQVLEALRDEGLTQRLDLLRTRTEVSVKLSAVGQALPDDGEKIALEHARVICAKARSVGAAVTLDMEDHTTTDSTLEVLRQLRVDFPETGAVLQSYLRRTEADCRDLAYAGSRVRLCKGAYDEPAGVAYQRRIDVNRSYVRCMNVLFQGGGYPMFATHDPRLIDVVTRRAAASGKTAFEMQMLYGVRPEEQRRLVGDGHTVRIYLPYGSEWYRYLVRRLAERPANLAFFVRALISRG